MFRWGLVAADDGVCYECRFWCWILEHRFVSCRWWLVLMVQSPSYQWWRGLGQVGCWNRRALYHVSPRECDPDYPPPWWPFIMSDWVGDGNLSVAVVIQCRVLSLIGSRTKTSSRSGGRNLLLLTPSFGSLMYLWIVPAVKAVAQPHRSILQAIPMQHLN